MSSNQAGGASGFGYSLAINGGIGTIAFLAFCYFRLKHPHIYNPRSEDNKRNLSARGAEREREREETEHETQHTGSR